MKPEIAANVEYVKRAYKEGREEIRKGELPHPKSWTYTKRYVDVLAEVGSRILLYSRE